MAKGTVTPMAGMFSVEEAQRAAQKMQELISEEEKRLQQLKDFIADNNSLINLVRKLPDELHHDIMVPFGKAAFFPGRLIHTNEFLVLLGEGYHAERTAKQTIDILKRRGKALESNYNALKMEVQNHKFEASKFDDMAAEVAEGLVEITEEYVEENSAEAASVSDTPGFSEANNMKVVSDSDDDFSRIMSRMDELEREELAAESNVECFDGEEIGNDSNYQHSLDAKNLEVMEPPQWPKEKNAITEALSRKSHEAEGVTDWLTMQLGALKGGPAPKGATLPGKAVQHNAAEFNHKEKALLLPEVKEGVSPVPRPKKEVGVPASKSETSNRESFTGSIVEHTSHVGTNAFTGSVVEHPSNVGTNVKERATSSSQAFTGSIVEHSHNLGTDGRVEATSSSQAHCWTSMSNTGIHSDDEEMAYYWTGE
ncbi:Prefoldin alpha-like [Dillenia turbinata]|uniref:Prefoldin alpha-like n=1 Tax=Dillenia turbinata TaxID=194707 RepID=A0AAN8UPS1_9MAGN